MKTISKRFLKASVAMLLVVIMLFSSTISGFAAVVDNADTKANVDVAKTGAISTGSMLYLNTGGSSLWEQQNAWFSVYFMDANKSTTKFETMTNIGTNLYSVAAPSGTWTYVIFVRNNPTDKTADWTNIWNQTADLELQSGKNLYTITGWGGNDGSWSTYENPKPSTPESATVVVNNATKGSGTSADPYIIVSTDSFINMTVSAPLPSGAIWLYSRVEIAEDDNNNKYNAHWEHNATSYTYQNIVPAPGVDETNTITVKLWSYNYSSGTTSQYSSSNSTKTIYVKTVVAGYDYTVAADPSEGGTVSDGTSTGASVSGTATTVTLQADPKDSHEFKGWYNGDTKVSDDNPFVLTLTGDINYTAKFEKKTFTVKFFDHDGTQIGDSQTVEYGGSATEPSKPNTKPGHTCTGWDTEFDNVTSNLEVTAVYTPNTQTVNVTIAPTDSGTVTINNSSDNPGSATYGEDVTVKATPENGYHFVGWSGTNGTEAVESNVAEFTFECIGDITLTATFALNEYTVTFVDAQGTLNTQTVMHGNPADAPTARDKEGYTFTGWDKDFSNVTDDLTVTAEYTVNKYQLIVQSYEADGTNTGFSAKVSGTGIADTQFSEDYDDGSLYTIDNLEHGTYTVKINSLWDTAGYVIREITVNGTLIDDDFSGYVKEYSINVDVHDDTVVNVLFDKRGKRVDFIYNGESSETPETLYVEPGTCVTADKIPEAIQVEGKDFIGWTVNDEVVDNVANYVINDDTEFVAKYEEITYNLTIDVPTGVDSVEFISGLDEIPSQTITETTTISEIPYGTGIKLEAVYDENNYKFVEWQSSDPDFVLEETASTPLKGNVKDITLTPVVSPIYSVVLNDVEEGKFAEGDEVKIYSPISESEYVVNLSSTPNVDMAYDYEYITFTMPGEDITINFETGMMYQVTFDDASAIKVTGKKDYYKPGETVNFTAQINDVGSLESIVYGNQTFNADSSTGVVTVNFTMPAEDVTLTVNFSQSFEMKAVVSYFDPLTMTAITIDSNGTYGTVEITGVDNTGMSNAPSVTYTAESNSNEYIFAGYYSDPQYQNLVAEQSVYTINRPSENTTLYALFVKGMFIPCDANNWDRKVPMSYDSVNKTYYYETYGTSQNFQITSAYDSWDGRAKWNDTGLSVSGTDGVTVTKGSGDNANANYSINEGFYEPVTIYYKPGSSTTASWSLWAEASTEPDTSISVVLSSGTPRVVLADKDFADIDTDTLITSTDAVKSISDKKTAGIEDYYDIRLEEAATIEFKTTISGNEKDAVYVYAYLVYDVLTQKSFSVTAYDQGNGVYTGSYTVTGACYITPVYFVTDEYCEDNEMTPIELVFDSTTTEMDKWGPFVSAYVYGDSTNTKYFGGWPGQIMVPDGSGTHYTLVTIPKGSKAQAFVFNNAVEKEGGIPYHLRDRLNLPKKSIVQTYDYREAITLTEMDYDLITFRYQESPEYHGDGFNSGYGYIDGSSPSTSKITISNYTFDYLDSRDYNLMNLNGEEILDANSNPIPASSATSSADFYIVSKGDVTIAEEGYGNAPEYSGQWSVEWYVYDSQGNYLTHGLSDTFYHPNGTENQPSTLVQNVINKLKTTDSATYGSIDYSYFDDKVVKISYEAPNGKGDHYLSCDGQWYGSFADVPVPASVYVAFENADGTHSFPEPETNDADFGKGVIITEDGDEVQNTDISFDIGKINLSAIAKGHNTFVGWYKMINGALQPIPNGDVPNLTNYEHNAASVYYAVFRAIKDTEVIINHSVYFNPTDSYIPSHGGVANMSIALYDEEHNLIEKRPASINGATLSFEADEFKNYWIEIITTPMQGGRFNAWYIGAKDEANKDTFEEILMKEEFEGSKTTVSNKFKYYGDSEIKSINIYSDVMPVSGNVTIQYKYKNREGNLVSIIQKDIKLTPEEITGLNTDGSKYLGNEGQTYCPQYIDSYILTNSNNETVHAFTEAEKNAYIAQGYSDTKKTYNKIQEYAPRPDVTQVFKTITSWEITDSNYEYEESYFTVTAVQSDDVYDFTYEINGKTTTLNNKKYNESVSVKAPTKLDNGDVFLYWQEMIEVGDEQYDEGNRLCYTFYYNYRVEGDKYIKAVYGSQADRENLELWNPIIDRVVYTREYSTSHGDYTYTDFLLAFNSLAAEELDVVKGSTIKYGLIMVRENGYVYDESDGKNTQEYPDDAVIHAGVEKTATNGKNTGIIGTDGKQYLGYCYDLSEEDTTNFNRINYHVKFNSEKHKGYTFTCYAYMKLANGQIVLSDPVNTSIWDTATAPVN